MTDETNVPQDVAEAEPVQQPEPVDTTTDTGAEVAAESGAEQETETEQTPEEPKRKPWFQTRIDEVTREKYAERQGREAAEKKAAELEAVLTRLNQNGQVGTPTGTDPGAVDQDAVLRTAKQLLAQQESERKIVSTIEQGRKDYPDFDERSELVVNGLGLRERPEFGAIISDLDNGHAVVAHLADNPETALRLRNLPAHQMALELGKLSQTVSKPTPKPISKVPKPVQPIDGKAAATVDIYDEKTDVRDYVRTRLAQDAAKRGQR